MEKNNKEKKITIRLSTEEHEILEKQALQVGKNTSQYLRSLLHNSSLNEIDLITLEDLTATLQSLKNDIKNLESKKTLSPETLNNKKTKENQIQEHLLSEQLKKSSNKIQEKITSIQEGVQKLWESLN